MHSTNDVVCKYKWRSMHSISDMCKTLRHYTYSSHCERRKGIRSGGIDPQILNIRIKRVVASFRLRPLYSRRKGTRHPLNKGLAGPQSRCEPTAGQQYSLVMLATIPRPSNPQQLLRCRSPTSSNLFLYLYWIPQKLTFGDARLEFPGRTKLGIILLNKKWM